MSRTEQEQIFDALWDEVSLIHSGWVLYRQLYGNAERVELLNRSTRAFFGRLHWVLLDHVLLGICRVTDPAESGGHRNLTLETLLRGVPCANKLLVATLEGHFADARQKSVPFRTRRNKKVAHADLELAIDDAEPLSGVSRATVEGALQPIVAFMNAYEVSLNQDPTEFGAFDYRAPTEILHALRLAAACAELEAEGLLPDGALANQKWSAI
jgi:hypothetical protein